MRYYDKMALTYLTSGTVPKLSMQIADIQCHHCGQITRVPVRPEWVNWEQVAEKYRLGYEKMVQRFDQIVTDITVMHSGPNPILEYIENEWKVLLDDLRNDLEA